MRCVTYLINFASCSIYTSLLYIEYVVVQFPISWYGTHHNGSALKETKFEDCLYYSY